MRDLLRNKQSIGIVVFLSLFVLVPVVIFLGFRYLAPIALLVGIYFFITHFQYENIIAPSEFEKMRDELSEKEEVAMLIREHVANHDGDLQAKFELREIEKEIEELKKRMGL